MDEYKRQAALQQQRALTCTGKVFYEEGGLGTLGEIHGEVQAVGSAGFMIFADPALLCKEQHNVFIPMHRVVRVEFEPVL